MTSNISTPQWLRDGFEHIWLPYTAMKDAPLPLPVKESEGVRLTLEDGRELIDGCSSWWTAVHGYRHPHIMAAISDQLGRMPHVMFGGLANEPAYRLASRLSSLLPGDLSRVFLAESGSVAVEVALKLAMQYWMNKGEPNRKKILCFEGAYHGDTFGTMSVCDPEEGMHSLFKGALLEQPVLPLPDTQERQDQFNHFLEENAQNVAAVIIEPLVQGAGGFLFHEKEVLRFIKEATERHNILFIADEIMTGFGRTGSFFACNEAGIVPDIITLSKALTGGVLPLSATISSEHISEVFNDGPHGDLMHGPTYTGHALACAAANASLDLFENEPRLSQIASLEEQMRRQLAPALEIDGVVDVRIRGAIGVIQVDNIGDINWLKARFVEKGVFIRPFNDVIYITPPYIISEEDLQSLTNAMLEVTSEWSERR